jgi:N6-L-threonylcarbamoyladenine synthase
LEAGILEKMSNLNTLVLGIESTCDDTSCAVSRGTTILSNVVASQAVHIRYGGVVPELASRDHQKNIVPVAQASLAKAGVDLRDISAIAVARGPGLSGSLLVGFSFAKSLSASLGIPLIGVNHVQAHVLAHFIEEPGGRHPPAFPFICLTVSGGHTQLVRVNAPLDFTIMGETLDDAAGEAFDKAAKLLGLPYPGGPELDKLAGEGDPNAFQFAAPRIGGLDFSFSGVKTSFLYFLQERQRSDVNFVRDHLHDICASYQRHVVDILMKRVRQALQVSGIRTLALSGGVSANSRLRSEALKLKDEGIEVHIPRMEYCTDNAAMIAVAGYYCLLEKRFVSLDAVPLPRMPA